MTLQDHPRLCGEKCRGRGRGDSIRGSPPPMRGKGDNPLRQGALSRITPAYAGKSVAQNAIQLLKRDHPRLCGEKYLGSMIRDPTVGSPPPMRGKVSWQYDPGSDRRITPAYAGKSCSRWSRCTGIWDHPRLCGEKVYFNDVFIFHAGSPPPMRGKDESRVLFAAAGRITSAYAGKNPAAGACRSDTPDHPRLCGEKRAKTLRPRRTLGSPPPMRGKEK